MSVLVTWLHSYEVTTLSPQHLIYFSIYIYSEYIDIKNLIRIVFIIIITLTELNDCDFFLVSSIEKFADC